MSDGATGVAPAHGSRAGFARAGRGAGRLLDPLAARLEGTGGVWWPAALVGVVMLGLILWQLAIPREYFTGTNSVAISSVVANVEKGQTLCVPGLQLPGETGRIQLAVFAHTPTVRRRGERERRGSHHQRADERRARADRAGAWHRGHPHARGLAGVGPRHRVHDAARRFDGARRDDRPAGQPAARAARRRARGQPRGRVVPAARRARSAR